MNSPLCRYALILWILIQSAVFGAEATIYLADSTRLSGRFAGLEGKDLLWKRPDFDRALRLPCEQVQSIVFPPGEEKDKKSFGRLLKLRSGAELMVSNIRFDGEALQADTVLGPIQIPRKHLAAIFYGYDPASIYRGPNSAEEWSTNHYNHGVPARLKVVNQTLIPTQSSASAYRRMEKAPPKFLWSFVYQGPDPVPARRGRHVHQSTAIRLNLSLSFHSKKGGMYHHVRINSYSNTLSLYTGNGGSRRIKMPKALQNKTGGHIQLAVDRHTGRIQFAIDQILVFDERVMENLPESVNFQFSLYSRSCKGISKIRIEPWDGLPLQGLGKKDNKSDLLLLPNGDLNRSPIVSITPETIATRAAEVPTAYVHTIRFGGGPVEKAPNEGEAIKVRLQGGGRFLCSAFQGTADGIAIQTAGLGLLKIPKAALRDIRWPTREINRVGYIQSWLLLGPIPVEGKPKEEGQLPNGVFDTPFAPVEKYPKAAEQVKVESRRYQWRDSISEDNLITPPARDNHLYVGVVYIQCQKPVEKAILHIGSDDDSLWHLNGTEVIRHEGPRSLEPDQDQSAPLSLKKGQNVLRFVLFNRSGPTGITARFLDKRRFPISGLTFGSKPEQAAEPKPAPVAKPEPARPQVEVEEEVIVVEEAVEELW